MGRRWGKTVMGGALSLLTASQGGRVAWLVPNYKNGNPLWRWAESTVAPLRKAGLVKTNKAERIIEFPNGGFLGIYSTDNGDGDAVRGENFHLAVLDEAARISEAAWTDAIQPTLADTGGDAILISTPKGRNWFWQEWQHGKTDMRDVAAWTAPSANNPNPKIQEAARKAKERIPDKTYRQEWLAEFVDEGGIIFDRAWWADGLNRYDIADGTYKHGCIARWLSFDTALKDKDTSAYTACTVGELQPDYRLSIREVWRDRLTFPYLPAKIEQMATRYNADKKLRGVIIEDKVSGTSAIQTISASSNDWLKRLIIPFDPKVGDKRQRAEQAAVWCQHGCVLLPYPAENVRWLFDFEDELYSFPDSDFADQVDTFSQLILYTENLLAEGWRARGGGHGLAA